MKIIPEGKFKEWGYQFLAIDEFFRERLWKGGPLQGLN